jgi:dUTP pyrophosphatase
LNIKLLNENAKIPTRGSEEAAGWDLYAAESVIIEPGQTTMVSTEIAIEVPFGNFGGIFARSGLATKQGLRPANCVGVIDSDYRGPVKVALYNDSNETRVVEIGERIAQLVIIPYTSVSINVVDELSNTERGDGGFGSTGMN